MVDGDGCISLQTSGQTNRFRTPILVVDNTDVEILEELQRLYGGSLVMKRRQQENHRQCWSWRVYGATNIAAVLREILPHMRCRAKIDRAKMLTEEWASVTPRNGHYTEGAREAKHAFEERFLAVGVGRGSGGQRRSGA